MPTDHNAQPGRRPHYNRGRRGTDRRGSGSDRRSPQLEQSGRPQGGDQIDVEQIMRDIRARIAQRHGIELTTQQVQELAARRLEAILDPRTMSPSLMEQLRRGAGSSPEIAPAKPDPGYEFETSTLYESHRGFLRFMRRLLNPLLKLFVNPNPLIHALNTQARLNREGAVREAERERRQTEWNALHYDILQRLVTEVSRVSIEMQSLALRVESLSAKVDFNDRRVRSLESSVPQGRQLPPPRAEQPRAEPRGEQPRAEHVAAVPTVVATGEAAVAAAIVGDAAVPPAEGTRRKRRRRRGRRSGGGGMTEGAPIPGTSPARDAAAIETAEGALNDADEGDEQDSDEDDVAGAPEMPPVVAGFVSPPTVASDAPAAAEVAAPAPEPPAPEPVQPTPPRDEPSPAAPVDHADPGPPDR